MSTGLLPVESFERTNTEAMFQTDLYFECHVTLEPVDGFRLELLKEIAARYRFRVAELLMRNGQISRDDAFCTSRAKNYQELIDRLRHFCLALRSESFVVYRYKIENTLLDSKCESDTLGLL
jgi:hypothetical protein